MSLLSMTQKYISLSTYEGHTWELKSAFIVFLNKYLPECSIGRLCTHAVGVITFEDHSLYWENE